MKIAHWSLSNGSGLNRAAYNICEGEKELGHNSIFIATDILKDGEKEGIKEVDKSGWEVGMDADVHVAHSTLPDELKGTKAKVVFVNHGTPEVCFQTAADGKTTGAWGLTHYWLRTADATVTFWPRHKYILDSISGKNTIVRCVPMGVNKEFWKPTESRGKYDGEPSVMSIENSHEIKWCYDLAIAWPEVSVAMPHARLHIHYLPMNQVPAFYPLFYANGLVFSSHISSSRLPATDLRNAFVSIDYYVNHVRYGDFNSVGLEAKATGCKVISYAGNPYADYWLSSQDQRIIAKELIQILKGNIEPRKDVAEPCDVSVTSTHTLKLYEELLHVPNI